MSSTIKREPMDSISSDGNLRIGKMLSESFVRAATGTSPTVFESDSGEPTVLYETNENHSRQQERNLDILDTPNGSPVSREEHLLSGSSSILLRSPCDSLSENQFVNAGFDRSVSVVDIEGNIGSSQKEDACLKNLAGSYTPYHEIEERIRNMSGSTTNLPKIVNMDERPSRNRVRVGNMIMPTREMVFSLFPFEKFGNTFVSYIDSERNYAFIYFEKHANAERAVRELNGLSVSGRSLNVKMAPLNAAIIVKNLTPFVSNELLAFAFSVFGQVERAVILTDEKGNSKKEGIVKFSSVKACHNAVKFCQERYFLLTSSTVPAIVDYHDTANYFRGISDDSLKRKEGFVTERQEGPRFAARGSFEEAYGREWNEVYRAFVAQLRSIKRDFDLKVLDMMARLDISKSLYRNQQLELELKTNEKDLLMKHKRFEELSKMRESEMRNSMEQPSAHLEQEPMPNVFVNQYRGNCRRNRGGNIGGRGGNTKVYGINNRRGSVDGRGGHGGRFGENIGKNGGSVGVHAENMGGHRGGIAGNMGGHRGGIAGNMGGHREGIGGNIGGHRGGIAGNMGGHRGGIDGNKRGHGGNNGRDGGNMVGYNSCGVIPVATYSNLGGVAGEMKRQGGSNQILSYGGQGGVAGEMKRQGGSNQIVSYGGQGGVAGEMKRQGGSSQMVSYGGYGGIPGEMGRQGGANQMASYGGGHGGVAGDIKSQGGPNQLVSYVSHGGIRGEMDRQKGANQMVSNGGCWDVSGEMGKMVSNGGCWDASGEMGRQGGANQMVSNGGCWDVSGEMGKMVSNGGCWDVSGEMGGQGGTNRIVSNGGCDENADEMGRQGGAASFGVKNEWYGGNERGRGGNVWARGGNRGGFGYNSRGPGSNVGGQSGYNGSDASKMISYGGHGDVAGEMRKQGASYGGGNGKRGGTPAIRRRSMTITDGVLGRKDYGENEGVRSGRFGNMGGHGGDSRNLGSGGKRVSFVDRNDSNATDIGGRFYQPIVWQNPVANDGGDYVQDGKRQRLR